MRPVRSVLATLLLLASAAAGHAEGPAVSALNGKVSLEAGALGERGISSALGIAQGSVTMPLGHSFGLQLDGAGATAFNSFAGGGAAHLFWRDPSLGLVGPIAVLVGGSGARIGLYGGEAELYAGPVTLGVSGGYQEATSVAGTLSSGGFYAGHLTVYPIADLALSIEGGQAPGQAIGRGGIEFQPELMGSRRLSLFVDAGGGDGSLWFATTGLRFHFGPEKSLIRRHREDDPSNLAQPVLMHSKRGCITDPNLPGCT